MRTLIVTGYRTFVAFTKVPFFERRSRTTNRAPERRHRLLRELDVSVHGTPTSVRGSVKSCRLPT